MLDINIIKNNSNESMHGKAELAVIGFTMKLLNKFYKAVNKQTQNFSGNIVIFDMTRMKNLRLFLVVIYECGTELHKFLVKPIDGQI